MFRNMETNPLEHENDICSYRNTILNHSGTSLGMIPDSCVHLMVTSPPYNVGKDYDDDMILQEYLTMLSDVFSETYRIV